MNRDNASQNNDFEKNKIEKNVIALGWDALFGGLSKELMPPIFPTFYL
jgi:hypothetical protein